MSLVVVGVDGSEHGSAALAFAAEEAALRGADLRIVCSWETPAGMTMEAGMVPGIFDSFREEAETIVRDAADWVRQVNPGLSVEMKVVGSHPVTALLEEGRAADVLVVGTRGRGELAGILLGSVSQHLIHQAPCPVTVVPMPPKEKSS